MGSVVSDDKGELVPAKEPELPAERPELSEEDFARQLIAAEVARTKAHERRTDVAMRMVEAADSADKRQFEFHRDRLEKEDGQANRRLNIVATPVYAIVALLVLFICLVLYMMFFGDSEQAATAKDLLRVVMAAGGGGGIAILIYEFVRTFLLR